LNFVHDADDTNSMSNSFLCTFLNTFENRVPVAYTSYRKKE